MPQKPPGPFSDQEREDILHAMMRHNAISRNDAEKLYDGNPQGRRNPLLERQWVQHLVYSCRQLCERKNDGFCESIFFIKLYGAVTELLERFSRSASAHPNAPAQSLVYRFFAGNREVFEACRALRESLSEDERVCLTMLRHIQAHVYQHGFELQVRRGDAKKNRLGGVKADTMVPLVGRHVDVEEAHRILDEMCRLHGPEGEQLGIFFATKVAPGVLRLWKAMEALAKLRLEDEAETQALMARRAVRT